jgi:mono/diheme cytochrome c family protein
VTAARLARSARGLLGAAALAVALYDAAQAAGDAAQGAALARQWCASCHVVDVRGTGKDIAPAFPEIALHGTPEQRQARAFLQVPHPRMPGFDLARAQIDDIVAYLNSLAAPRP